MALAPKFAAQKFSASSPSQSVHTLELYLDYVCPYSAKLFNAVYHTVFPIVQQKYASKVSFIFRHQVQPWHPSSTLVHESALAVLNLSPEKFWPYSDALFKDQKAYFDVNVVTETRNETYKKLSLLGKSVGVDDVKMYDLLKIGGQGKDGSLNVGNAVTDNLKVLVKAARLVGVHVSPTVIFNGVVENSISSGWGRKSGRSGWRKILFSFAGRT